MLTSLEIIEAGPAPRLAAELAPRLNVFAGDNGLGKSFLLDVIWWALSGTWADLVAWPRPDERIGAPASRPAITLGMAQSFASSFLSWEHSDNIVPKGDERTSSLSSISTPRLVR